MTPYLSFLVHLATVSGVVLPGLLAALAIARYGPVSPLAKVWILRITLVGSLLACFGLGIPVAVSGGSSGGPRVALPWLSLAVGLYAAGVITFGGEFLRDLRTVRRLYRDTAPAPFEALRVANQVAAAMGLPHSPPVRRANAGESVLLVAARRATILLPNQTLDGETLRLALAHEMAHVRHRDLLWSGVAALARCLLWFHPGVHFAVRRLMACQEAAADRAALLGTAAPTRRYAEMLIGVATARRQVPLIGASAASVREDVEERLRSLYAPRPTPSALSLAVAVIALTAVPWRPIVSAAVPVKPMADVTRVFAPIRIAAPVGG